MIERLSHEPAPAPAEDDGRSDRLQALELLRAQLSRTISEGLGQSSVAGQWGEIDNAEIAAFLDDSLSRAEREAVATRLASDPVARAELAAAAAMLDEIQAQPATAPADLMGRAADVLAAPEQSHPRVSAVAVWRICRKVDPAKASAPPRTWTRRESSFSISAVSRATGTPSRCMIG